MTTKQISLSLLVLLNCLVAVFAQGSPSNTLQLDSPQEYSLPAGQPTLIQLPLPESRPASFDLLLRAAPLSGDPFQVPLLSLQAGQFKLECFSASAEFAGVCRVPARQLVGVQRVQLTLRCLVQCDLVVDAYMAAVVRVAMGDSVELRAHSHSLSEVVHIEAPKGSDPLAVSAVLINPQQTLGLGEEGIELLINVGADVQDPDEANFKIKGSSLNGGGKGAFLYNTNEGELIRCLITLKPGVAVRFGVSPVRGNRFQVELGQSYYDYALPAQPKVYSLDLQQLPEQDTLELVFDIYSGQPKFDLSFSESFIPPIDFVLTSSAESFLLSSETRRRFNQSSTLYLRVSASATAEYYFYSSVVRPDVAFLQPYLTYFDQIEQNTLSNYILLQRHRLDEQESLVRNYSFKVDIRSGSGTFHFKRCPSLQRPASENPHIDDCLITAPKDLRSDKFYAAEIQNRHIKSGNMLTIFMEYDVARCTSTQEGGVRHALCAFHIIVGGTSPEPFEYSLQVERKYGAVYLKEGKLVKEYIPRDSYAYFVLSLPDVGEVQQANLFLTALSGEVALIVSRDEPLPSLKSVNALSQGGSKCNIVLEGDKLAKEIYVAVYAYRFTEVNLGVIVHRKHENGSSHDIPLLQGNPHTYVLNRSQPAASFIITAKKQQAVTLLVNQLAGHVSLAVSDPSGKAIICNDVPKDRLRCSFRIEKAGNYSVRVEGQKQSPQCRFSISYSSEQSPCFPSSLNTPIFVSLPVQAKHCYQFALNREIDLQVSLSLSALAVMDRQVVGQVLLNDVHFAQVGTHSTLTVVNMLEVCPMGTLLGGFVHACRVSVKLENKGSTEAHFSLVVQQQDAEIALFDGVSERVRGMAATVGKNFYYHVGTARRLQLFFSTQSLRSHYFMAARFATPAEFIGRGHTDIYLPYVAERDRPPQRIDNRDNYYSAVLGRTGLETVSIDPPAIKQFCPQDDCYLLLSVYREQYENSLEGDEDYYQLQVTQEETVLQLGESRVGVVDKGEVYVYLVEPEDAVVQFAMLQAAGKQKGCLQSQAATVGGKVLRKNELAMALQVSKSEGVERIYVRGLQDGCSFSISYLSNQNPFHIARLSHPYELELQGNQTARFIYYHQSPSTFKLASLVSAGAANVHIVPMRSEFFTLSSLSKLNLKRYTSSSFDGEFSMLQSDINFCSKCYYYVVVSAQRPFVGQVVFLRLYDPVPLSINHVFKERLVPLTPLGVQNYIFYALASFNITLNMLSGRVAVTVVDPEGKVVVNQEITQKTTYLIRSIDYQERQAIPYYSERARYRIRVSAIKEAEFYIETTRQQSTQRIFEGLPTLLSIDPAHPQTLEFISSQNTARPLNLMVDVEEGEDEAVLTFSLRGEKPDGSAVATQELLQNITQSDNTYILDLMNFGGRYFVEVHSSRAVKTNIILVRSTLTHLAPTHNYLFNRDAVYQLSSSFKKVMIEVFNCQGELSLVGSRDQRDMQDGFSGPSPIALQRANYAGHYVFTSDMSFSSYFLRVRNKQPEQPLEYLISYYYFDQINPYDVIQPTNYYISAQYDRQGALRLTVNPPALTEYQRNSNITVEIVIVGVKYSAYVAANRRELNRGSRCNIQGGFVQKKDSTSPTITLEKEILSELQPGPEATLYATVQAVVTIQFKHDDKQVVANSPKVVTLLYDRLEMAAGEVAIVVQSTYAFWFTDSLALFVGWMMLPFVLAAATLFYLMKYCIRRLMMRQASMVEEVDIVGGNQTVPTEQKLAVTENGPLPETGQQMIKESI